MLFFVMTYRKNLQLCHWTPLGAYCGPQTPASFSSFFTFAQSHVLITRESKLSAADILKFYCFDIYHGQEKGFEVRIRGNFFHTNFAHVSHFKKQPAQGMCMRACVCVHAHTHTHTHTHTQIAAHHSTIARLSAEKEE